MSAQTQAGVITFENVITDVGGNWNSVGNTFVVLTPGMYFFFVSVEKLSGAAGAAVSIRRDREDVQNIHVFGLYEMSSGSVLLQLTPGTQISCWLNSGAIKKNLENHL